MAELAVKSYASPGTRVMSEDQIRNWANSIQRAEVECDASRGSKQVVALLKSTLAVQDHEIACL